MGSVPRHWPILALALASFAIGTTEFAIVGLLPDVAADLGVSLPRAGLLVSGYAIGVAVGGPMLVVLARGAPRKTLLIALLGVFVAGNLLSAAAEGYGMLMGGRLLASLTHGSFFGIGAVVASDIAGPQRRGAAIALMFSGLTVANVLGVPLGTLIGQTAGWRSTFLAVSVLGTVALAAVARLLPTCPPAAEDSGEAMSALRRPELWSALALTVVSFGGVFAAFTFITPMLVGVTRLTPHAAAATLFLFGLGMTFGNVAGGRLADWKLMPSLACMLIGLAAVELMFAWVLAAPAAAMALVFVWGFAAFCIVPGLQANVVNNAVGAEAFVSTLNVSAFNVGNAAGAWVGSTLVAADVPLRLLPVFAAGAAGTGALLAAASLVAARYRYSQRATSRV